MPPTPTPAIFSMSLGGVKPRPKTCRGTMVKALPVVAAPETAAAAPVVRNLRRDRSVFALIGPLATNYCSVKAVRKSEIFAAHSGTRDPLSWRIILNKEDEERFLHFASRLLRGNEGEEKASARSG